MFSVTIHKENEMWVEKWGVDGIGMDESDPNLYVMFKKQATWQCSSWHPYTPVQIKVLSTAESSWITDIRMLMLYSHVPHHCEYEFQSDL